MEFGPAFWNALFANSPIAALLVFMVVQFSKIYSRLLEVIDRNTSAHIQSQEAAKAVKDAVERNTQVTERVEKTVIQLPRMVQEASS